MRLIGEVRLSGFKGVLTCGEVAETRGKVVLTCTIGADGTMLIIN